MTRALPGSPTDWHHAPDHLVGLVAALAGPSPIGPTGQPTPQQWHAQIRRVVDQIWSTAWLAGATDTAARMPPPPIQLTVDAEGPLLPALAAPAAPRTGRAAADTPANR